MNKLLIGITAKARAGKDAFADALQLNAGSYLHRYAFADPLKKAGAEMFGIPLENFHDDDKKEITDEFWGFSPREIAQLLGTEGGRVLFRQDIWVKRAERFYDSADVKRGMVVTDVRFENEATWIRDMGGMLVHLTRAGADGVVGVSGHASEAGIELIDGDITIVNDGTLDDLTAHAKNLIKSLDIRRAA